jgi:hypothetical protein
LKLPGDLAHVEERDAVRLLHILEPVHDKTHSRYHQGVFYDGDCVASSGCCIIDCSQIGNVVVEVKLPNGTKMTISAG